MRITNTMMSNRMMLNINRNTAALDVLYTQMASKKKIQYASENPIIASRAIKLRTAVAETEQYQRNVASGQSWMDVTEVVYKQAIDMVAKIKELVTEADGAESYEDKQKIATNIEQITKELGLLMNKSYTGRYLFSGYRTDEPGVLTRDNDDMIFHGITQNFTRKDMEEITSYQKLNAGDEAITHDCTIIKLAYKYADTNSVHLYSTDLGIAGHPVTSVSINDVNAYKPGAGDVHYIAETGELVLGSNFTSAADISVTYNKHGFQEGDLNPKVYFDCVEVDTATGTYLNTYNMNNQDIVYEFGVGTRFPVNSLGKDVVTDKMYADLISFTDFLNRCTVSSVKDIKEALKQDPNNAGKTDEELQKLAENQQAKEKDALASIMQTRISNMLEIIETHGDKLAKSHTDLGARMERLELIEKRLEVDDESYRKLKSDNEDADLIELAMLIKDAENTFNASLMVGMNMIQVSLVNFL